MPQPAVRPE